MIETRTVYYDLYQLPKLDKSLDIPGYQIPLSLRDENGNELGSTVVAEDGSFTIQLSRLPIASDWIVIIPNWYVNNELKFGMVVGGQNTPFPSWAWSFRLIEYGQNSNFSNLGTLRISEAEGSGALYIYQQLVKAYQDLIDNHLVKDLSVMPSMAVAWNPGISWTCGSCYVHNYSSEIGKTKTYSTLYIGGDSKDESAWGYPTILHEFGHYVLASLYRDSTSGGTHNFSTPCDPQVAWSEGFATFYYLMAQSKRTGAPVSQYWRVLKSGSFWLDYAHLYDTGGFGSIVIPKPKLDSTAKMKQNLPEGWVTFMLYNFWDGLEFQDLSSPPDKIRLGTAGIFNALASPRYMKFGQYYTSNRKTYGADFVDFTDALVCGINDTDFTNITDFIIEYEFPYDLEPICPL